MSDELLGALRELRADPTIAPILAAASSRQNEWGEAGAGASVPSSEPSVTDNHPTQSRAQEPLHTPQQRDRQRREREREEVGVQNWLQRHRDEVSNSESRRLHNRLRAEHLVASTQLEFESFKAEHLSSQARTSGEGAEAEGETEKGSTHANAESEGPLERESIGTMLGIPGAATTAAGAAAAVATEMKMRSECAEGNFVLQQQRIGASLSAQFSSHNEKECRSKDLDSIINARPAPSIDTERELGPVDLEENYKQKQRVLFGEGRDDDSARRGLLQRAGSPRGADVDALIEAVRHRDQTILRLERQLREDRDYYENQITKVKYDVEHARAQGESRVAALRAQVDNMLAQQHSKVESTNDDVNVKISQMQFLYDRSVAELRQQTMRAIETFHTDAEKKVRDVCDRAETAIRSAKEQYRIERTDIISREKEKLIERLSQEQNVMLRETELKLRNNVEAQLLTKLKYEMERGLRSQLRSELLPMVQKQVLGEVRGTIMTSFKADIEHIFVDRERALLQQLQEELDESAQSLINKLLNQKQQQQRYEQLSRGVAGGQQGTLSAAAHRNPGSTVQGDSVEVAGIEILQSQLTTFSRLMEDVEREAHAQEVQQAEHTAVIQAASVQVESLQDALDTEAVIAATLQEQLQQLGRRSPSAAPNAGEDERHSSITSTTTPSSETHDRSSTSSFGR